MDIAPAALVGPLLMLLSYVALGWLAAQRLKLDPRPIATLLVYLIAPFTIFRALMNGGPTPDYLLLTLALFILASLMALVVQRITRHRFGEHEAALWRSPQGRATPAISGCRSR